MSWASKDGSSAPLGATWVAAEQAYNFALYSENAERVTLLLYAARDLVNPAFSYRFDQFRNKTGPVWHARIHKRDIADAEFYGYSVAGPSPGGTSQKKPPLHMGREESFQAETHDFVFLLIGFLALGSALISPNLTALISKRGGNHRAGELLGARNAVNSLAQAGGPILGGAFFAWKPNSPYLLTGAASVAAALVIRWRMRSARRVPTLV